MTSLTSNATLLGLECNQREFPSKTYMVSQINALAFLLSLLVITNYLCKLARLANEAGVTMAHASDSHQ